MLQNPAFLVKLVFVLLAVTTLALTWTRVFRGPHERQDPGGRVARVLVRRAQRGPPDGLHRRVCLVNLAHLHLLLNHFPTVGLGIALGLLLASLLKKSEDLKQAGFVAFFLLGLVAIPPI